MSRTNFREIRDRFTHIDAEFVSCQVNFGGGESHYTVSFYPWWEHPLYLLARDKGEQWGFEDYSAGFREVTVCPLGLRECLISSDDDITEWAFLDSHPRLWSYEDRVQIFCNSVPPMDKLVAQISANLPDVSRATVYQYLDPCAGHPAPSCLGTFPLTLFRVVRAELQKLGVDTFVDRLPQRQATPVLLLIDDEDYIIADDFEVDVPEFEHDPAWFKRLVADEE